MPEPKYTVVIPLYNNADTIRRALDSVLGQTFREFELIVVDDGSSDDGAAVVGGIHDSRLRFLHRETPGAGGYAARNLGISAATGTWVAFLDADDAWYPNHLELLTGAVVRHPGVVMVSSGWRIIHPETGERLNAYTTRYRSAGEHLIDLTKFLRRSVQGYAPFCTITVAIRSQWLIGVGGFPQDRCLRGGDVDTWLRIMLSGGKAVWTPHIGAIYYRKTAGSVTTGTRPEPRDDCSHGTIVRYLETNPPRALQRELKRFANYKKEIGLRTRMRAGELNIPDVRQLFFGVQPLLSFLYLAFALLPRPAKLAIVRLYLIVNRSGAESHGIPGH